MTPSSDVERHRTALRETLAREKASGLPVDTSWSDDLPSDPLPSEGEDTSVTFVKKSGPPTYGDVLKWDRNQPRGPKGTHEGGRWVKDVSAGVVESTQGFKESSGIVRMARAMSNMGNANYADIMNAPMGTGFGNAPRLTGDPEMVKRLTPSPQPRHSRNSRVVEALSTANVAESEELDPGGHANTAFMVTLDDANETKAVLKPEVGERWTGAFSNGEITSRITNRDFSLAEREATAYEVSEALGLGLVPATVLRETIDGIDLGNIEAQESGYDPDEIEDMYRQYREKAQEDAYDLVSDEMGQLFDEARDEHLKDIQNRNEEATEIWNELVEKEFPDTANLEAQREHPVLPMGSQPAFERRDPVVLDPLELLDEAGVDVSSSMTEKEEENLRAIMRKHLEEGAQELGDLDEDAAKDHLDRDRWIEDHADTEGRLLDEKIKSLDSWKQEHGFSSGGGRGGGVPNDQAPHPGGASLQMFVEGLKSWGHITPEETRKFAVLDYVIGSMDRHGHNVAYDDDGNAVAIDNGYAFPDSGSSDSPHDFTFRSNPVIDWRSQFGGGGDQIMPDEEREKIAARLEAADWKALVARHPNMSRGEREALLGRVERMREALNDTSGQGLINLWRRLPLEY